MNRDRQTHYLPTRHVNGYIQFSPDEKLFYFCTAKDVFIPTAFEHLLLGIDLLGYARNKKLIFSEKIQSEIINLLIIAIKDEIHIAYFFLAQAIKFFNINEPITIREILLSIDEKEIVGDYDFSNTSVLLNKTFFDFYIKSTANDIDHTTLDNCLERLINLDHSMPKTIKQLMYKVSFLINLYEVKLLEDNEVKARKIYELACFYQNNRNSDLAIKYYFFAADLGDQTAKIYLEQSDNTYLDLSSFTTGNLTAQKDFDTQMTSIDCFFALHSIYHYLKRNFSGKRSDNKNQHDRKIQFKFDLEKLQLFTSVNEFSDYIRISGKPYESTDYFFKKGSQEFQDLRLNLIKLAKTDFDSLKIAGRFLLERMHNNDQLQVSFFQHLLEIKIQPFLHVDFFKHALPNFSIKMLITLKNTSKALKGAVENFLSNPSNLFYLIDSKPDDMSMLIQTCLSRGSNCHDTILRNAIVSAPENKGIDLNNNANKNLDLATSLLALHDIYFYLKTNFERNERKAGENSYDFKQLNYDFKQRRQFISDLIRVQFMDTAMTFQDHIQKTGADFEERNLFFIKKPNKFQEFRLKLVEIARSDFKALQLVSLFLLNAIRSGYESAIAYSKMDFARYLLEEYRPSQEVRFTDGSSFVQM